MKTKIFNLMLPCILLFPLSCFAQDNEIAIYLDKNDFHCEHEAIIRDGRLMLSLRDIGRLLDSEVIWQQEQNTAIISNPKGKMSFMAEQETVLVEQEQQTITKTMDTKSVNIKDRLYIPARFVSKISGFRVLWDSEDNRVDIISPKDKKTSEETDSSSEREDRHSESDSKTNRIVPTSEIHYSTETQDVDEIITYIKNNLDEDFDVTNFEVKTNLANAYLGTEIISTSISMKLKNGNFVTENGYYITVENGIVDNIFVKGNPAGSLNNADKEMANEIDEEWLKELALKNMLCPEGYKVTEQRVLKKYDGEPYYVVVVGFENSIGIGFLDTFEYRMK